MSGDYGQETDADKKIRQLQLELARQWLSNHAEHCGVIVPPWPHRGICNWPMPEELSCLGHSEVYLLLLQASGVSVEFHLLNVGD
jgi:hypothetical protein